MFAELKGLDSRVKLHNGVEMPVMGLGTWRIADGEEARSSVKYAIQQGYRMIDTAAAYYNETGVGQGIRESNVPREELFIVTKVANDDQGYDSTLKAFDESMKKLKLDYLDLYLIHWPGKYKFKDTWRAMEKLYEEGRVKAIGVCNFHAHHLDELIDSSSVVPMVNQVECHPLLNQADLHRYCKDRKIQLEAYSPLMRGHLDLTALNQLAEKYGKTPAQIVLRWDLQNGIVVIPKSVHPKRIDENSQVFDFELADEDMEVINSLNTNKRFCGHPDYFF
jgi:diketogulonate reductase-like aldo/keto reductase